MNLNLFFRFLLFQVLVLYMCFRLHVFLRRLIMAGEVFGHSLYIEDFFDRRVILFNSRICVCECSNGFNCLWRPLTSADICFCIYESIFLKKNKSIYKYVHGVCLFAYMNVHPCVRTYFQFSCCFLSLSLSLSLSLQTFTWMHAYIYIYEDH